jgi:hypothetical protein
MATSGTELSVGLAISTLAAGTGVGSAVGTGVGLGVGLGVGRAVGRAVGWMVGVGVGTGLWPGLGLTVGVAAAVGVVVGVGLGLGQASVGRARPAVGWTTAAYWIRISAAGTWLVVNAFSAMPGYAYPPSAPWPARSCVRTVLDPLDQAAASGSCPAATSAWRTIESESGSLAGGPHAEEFW